MAWFMNIIEKFIAWRRRSREIKQPELPPDYYQLKREIEAGDCTALEHYLAAGGDSDLGFGCCPLLELAITSHNIEAMLLLLSHGAKLGFAATYPNYGPYTALHAAAFNGYPDILRFLMRYYQDVDVRWQINTTALHEACMRRCGHACPAWDIHDEDHSPAEIQRFVECARLLLEAGANVNAPCMDWPGPQYDYTPLHFASDPPCPPLIELLLAWGADPNLVDSSSKTPAMYANRQ